MKKESDLVCVRSSAALMTLKSEMQCLAECSAVPLLAQMLQTAQVYSALVEAKVWHTKSAALLEPLLYHFFF